VGLQDEFYNQQLMQEHLLKPVLEIVIETMPRDNLLNSACLEFFEFIKRENIKVLIIHIVESYREELERIDYVDTFKDLILKYEQNQNAAAPSFTTVSTMPPTPEELNRRGQWQGAARELDPAEEEYFNTSDNEEEDESSKSRPEAHTNGSSPATKPLVDYNSDEDNDLLATDLSAGIETRKENTSDKASGSDAQSARRPLAAARPPPERLSEKRRREEDDEDDELDKLSNKRRSSMSSNASNSVLRRRKSFTSSRENGASLPEPLGSRESPRSGTSGGGGTKKIAISIMPTTIITTGREGDDTNGT